MQTKREENKEAPQNTATRELIIDTPSDELPTERLLDIDDADKKVQSTDENPSGQ